MGIGLGGAELAPHVLPVSFTATGVSPWIGLTGAFNLNVWGTFVATLALERSYDGGVTALPLSSDLYGTAFAPIAPMSVIANEPEAGVLYRLHCTAYTSGTVNARLSQ